MIDRHLNYNPRIKLGTYDFIVTHKKATRNKDLGGAITTGGSKGA
jgi:hypothetical protein